MPFNTLEREDLEDAQAKVCQPLGKCVHLIDGVCHHPINPRPPGDIIGMANLMKSSATPCRGYVPEVNRQ